MTQDYVPDHSPPDAAAYPRSRGPGRLVLAGVLGACALGVGLGLWARPSTSGAETPAAPPQVAKGPAPALQIVFDETPAPLGQPLEVLPEHLAPRAAPDLMAPSRAASGLVKVDAPVAAELLLEPVVRPPEAPRPAPKARAVKVRAPKVDVVRPEKAKVETAKAGKAELERAKAETARADKAKAEKAKVEKAKVEKAKSEQTRAEKTRIAEAKRAQALTEARAEKAERARSVKLAKAEKARAGKARAAKLARAETSKAKPLAVLVKRVKAEARQVVRRKPAQVAEAKPAKKAAKPVRRPAPERAVAARKPIPRGEGPLRVARANTCASADPGEALVCADRRLGARDRQLQQAYRDAEAAGVPASALRRQQTRWLQARAAAAREAPWAVEDVYEARISELNDLSQDARQN